jgi:hypothetical protein
VLTLVLSSVSYLAPANLTSALVLLLLLLLLLQACDVP